jgi:hypothetical protein
MRTATLAAVLTAGAAALLAAPAAHAARPPATYYVDCAHGNDRAAGTSADKPWRTTAKAGAAKLKPGGALLFKRGTTCTGTLAPQASGTAKHPIVMGAYGKGKPPVISGAGARAAIALHDVQGWTIRDLTITNPGPTTTVGVLRSGIQIDVDALRVAAGFTITGNTIRDVDTSPVAPSGESALNYSKVAGGIEVNASGTNVLSGVTITGNTLQDVAREGIVVRGGGPTKGLVVRGNTLKRIAGDGIVAVRAAKALLERNVVDGFNRMGTTSNAGMWSYHSTDVTFQFNDVSHGANGPLDGMAYDLDGGNERITFQYNLSHDNTGGFLMLCNDPDTNSGNSIVRYNISQNDTGGSEHAVFGAPPCGPQQNIRVYNNTIYTTDASAAYMVRNTNRSTVAFTNNLFVGPKVPAVIADGVATFDANLYANVTCRVDHPDAHAVVADPAFVQPGKARSLATATGYVLRKGSPALGAGVAVAGNGGRDYFGNPVPKAGHPNIGAYQGPGVTPKAGGTQATAPACG